MGISGRITQAFIRSRLTPLVAVASLAVGALALIATPREEEPQISVPMVDVIEAMPGASPSEAENLLGRPIEQRMLEIPGVDHVYTMSGDGYAMVTVRFKVGEDQERSVTRVQAKLASAMDQAPPGALPPVVKPHSIDDVPVLTLTLHSSRYDANMLRQVAGQLEDEIRTVPDVAQTFVVGGQARQIGVALDAARLVASGVTPGEVARALQGANARLEAGELAAADQVYRIQIGAPLETPAEVGGVVVAMHGDSPVYVRDVADVTDGFGDPTSYVSHEGRTGAPEPAVTIAVAKRQGANATAVTRAVLDRVHAAEGRLLPSDVKLTVTRDYGETAGEKAQELMLHLLIATVSVTVLIWLFLGWREAAVVLVAVPVTLALTLFAYYALGYTLNRITLFALIFSIGILVDDAIVVVENIYRHLAMGDRAPEVAAIDAVDEVGNPTILATLTVVAALLPMLFVSGLMGPYMAPIPANASAAMLFSFFVAMVIAPWLLLKLHREGRAVTTPASAHGEGVLGKLYRRVASPIIRTKRSAWIFLGSVGVATLLVMGLFYTKSVTVKLLPFDNKSEIAVVADLPEGASLEDTERVLLAASDIAKQLPEVTSVQVYAGTPAPFNFNGLVRHYYLREAPELGELQVNLTARGERSRASHLIALELRDKLKGLNPPEGTSIKVVEVPPGPPVLATLLAEVYGPDSKTRRAVMNEVKKIFASVPFIVDVDDSVGEPRPRLRLSIDQDRLEYFGVEQKDVYDTIEMLFGGLTVGYSHRGEDRNPIAITVQLPKRDLSWTQAIASAPVPANALPGAKTVVELGEVVRASTEAGSPTIFRRDGRFADMVMAELAGSYEAPIYGMLEVAKRIDAHDWGNLPKPVLSLHGQPDDESRPTLLWDGEWEITYVTFRDMGAAFAIAIVGIYILVVAQFGSFKLPLVILTPIPLTLIGILIGHWLFGAPFTATSMIGFIALAGIIVRNSILLVDFIRHSSGDGPLRERLLKAGAVRFKPILLTALAAMIGAATILPDPIFQGLAISLLFGLASSTLLTVLVIPAIYIALRDDGVVARR